MHHKNQIDVGELLIVGFLLRGKVYELNFLNDTTSEAKQSPSRVFGKQKE